MPLPFCQFFFLMTSDVQEESSARVIRPLCPANEEFRQCGTACEPSCKRPSPICTQQCTTPGCFCLPGLVRREDGRCVFPKDCNLRPKALCLVSLVFFKKMKDFHRCLGGSFHRYGHHIVSLSRSSYDLNKYLMWYHDNISRNSSCIG